MSNDLKVISYRSWERREMIPFLPPTYHRVLEVGCGKGAFFECLSGDVDYWGIEPDMESAREAQHRVSGCNGKILNGTYQDVCEKLPDDYFDLIICNDVIEHMESYDLFFKHISKKSEDKFYLMGSIPNVRYVSNLYEILIKKDWEYKNSGVLDKTHLRFFTYNSLCRIFCNEKFNIVKLKGINSISHSEIWWKRIIKSLPFYLIFFILGWDCQYKQFGFLVKKQ